MVSESQIYSFYIILHKIIGQRIEAEDIALCNTVLDMVKG